VPVIFWRVFDQRESDSTREAVVNDRLLFWKTHPKLVFSGFTIALLRPWRGAPDSFKQTKKSIRRIRSEDQEKILTAEYAGNSERTQRKERRGNLEKHARTKLKLKVKINAVRASHPDRILPRKFHVDPLTPQRAAHSVLCASFVHPAA
jgi:hypothetical protein